jgi:alkylhydroperoxidase family enzyme
MSLYQLRETLDEDEACLDGEFACTAAIWTSAEPAFSPLERQAIALGARDTLGSLEPAGRIERLVALVFGLRASSRALADPRLEALRRAAVVARHRRHLPDPVAAELREHGFGPARIGELERLALG